MSDSDDIDFNVGDFKDSWVGRKEPRECPKCGETMPYVEDSHGNIKWVCPHCGKVIYEGLAGYMGAMPLGSKIGRYFLHGIAFYLISLALVFAWILVGVTLVLLGSFIGLILAFLLLVFIIGAINTFVASLVWGFSMKTSWRSIFLHGLVLSIVLVMVSLLTTYPLYLVTHDWYYILLFQIGLCFVNGFIGETAAENWMDGFRQ